MLFLKNAFFEKQNEWFLKNAFFEKQTQKQTLFFLKKNTSLRKNRACFFEKKFLFLKKKQTPQNFCLATPCNNYVEQRRRNRQGGNKQHTAKQVVFTASFHRTKKKKHPVSNTLVACFFSKKGRNWLLRMFIIVSIYN